MKKKNFLTRCINTHHKVLLIWHNLASFEVIIITTMFRRIKVSQFSSFYQNYATKVELDASLKENFEAKVYKPRKHPGTTRIKLAVVPPDIQKAIKIILDDSNANSLSQDSRKLGNYLRSRLLPPEEGNIDRKAAKIYDSVSKRVRLFSSGFCTCSIDIMSWTLCVVQTLEGWLYNIILMSKYISKLS